MLQQPLLFTGCSSIQFFNSALSQTYLVRPHLVASTSLCILCVTYWTLCHVIGYQVLPTQPLSREAAGFPRGGKYFDHVPLLTQLIYFQAKGYLVRSIYILGSTTKHYINPSVVLNLIFNSSSRMSYPLDQTIF